MIAIRTYDGVFLDLKQDTEVEFTQEQPLLSTDKIPVPFSTAFDFPASPTNKDVFGYLPAMFLEPSNKEVKVVILANGLELMYGTLIYDGVEDGYLKYTFTGADLAETWNDKLNYSKEYVPEAAAKGLDNDVFLPLIINESSSEDVIYGVQGQTLVDSYVKYMNYFGWNGYQRKEIILSPCIKVRSILKSKSPNLILPTSDILNQMAILCQYRPVSISPSEQLSATKAVGPDNEPDVTYLDILKGVCSILCSAVFQDGEALTMKSAYEVLSAAPVNLDGKVSDEFSLSNEEGKNYKFAFSNSEDENSYDPKAASRTRTSYYDAAIDALNTEDDPDASSQYRSYKIRNTQDIIRCRGFKLVGDYVKRIIASYPTYHHLGNSTNDEGHKEDFDNACEFELVGCVPDIIVDANTTVRRNFMIAPVIMLPAADEERGGNVFVGLIKKPSRTVSGAQCQFTDKQFFGEYPSSTDEMGESSDGISMSPESLYQLHEQFAQWMGRNRRCVKVDLNLSALEIADLKLYRTVYFKGTVWLIKTLRFTVNTSGGVVSASGEFIEI